MLPYSTKAVQLSLMVSGRGATIKIDTDYSWTSHSYSSTSYPRPTSLFLMPLSHYSTKTRKLKYFGKGLGTWRGNGLANLNKPTVIHYCEKGVGILQPGNFNELSQFLLCMVQKSHCNKPCTTKMEILD